MSWRPKWKGPNPRCPRKMKARIKRHNRWMAALKLQWVRETTTTTVWIQRGGDWSRAEGKEGGNG